MLDWLPDVLGDDYEVATLDLTPDDEGAVVASVVRSDLGAALAVVRDGIGTHGRIMLVGHSTGGLVAALWAHRYPGSVDGLVLNSPWLELQGSSIMRHLSGPAVGQLARFQPKAPLPNIDPGYYARAVSAAAGGEWTYDERWRPTPSFPVRAGWLRAVMTGHAQVARGLTIQVPIIALASTRTLISARWSEDMRAADIVLEVDQIARRAVQLGPLVTVARIADGVHDLALSPLPARAVLCGDRPLDGSVRLGLTRGFASIFSSRHRRPSLNWRCLCGNGRSCEAFGYGRSCGKSQSVVVSLRLRVRRGRSPRGRRSARWNS